MQWIQELISLLKMKDQFFNNIYCESEQRSQQPVDRKIHKALKSLADNGILLKKQIKPVPHSSSDKESLEDSLSNFITNNQKIIESLSSDSKISDLKPYLKGMTSSYFDFIRRVKKIKLDQNTSLQNYFDSFIQSLEILKELHPMFRTAFTFDEERSYQSVLNHPQSKYLPRDEKCSSLDQPPEWVCSTEDIDSFPEEFKESPAWLGEEPLTIDQKLSPSTLNHYLPGLDSHTMMITLFKITSELRDQIFNLLENSQIGHFLGKRSEWQLYSITSDETTESYIIKLVLNLLFHLHKASDPKLHYWKVFSWLSWIPYFDTLFRLTKFPLKILLDLLDELPVFFKTKLFSEFFDLIIGNLFLLTSPDQCLTIKNLICHSDNSKNLIIGELFDENIPEILKIIGSYARIKIDFSDEKGPSKTKLISIAYYISQSKKSTYKANIDSISGTLLSSFIKADELEAQLGMDKITKLIQNCSHTLSQTASHFDKGDNGFFHDKWKIVGKRPFLAERIIAQTKSLEETQKELDQAKKRIPPIIIKLIEYLREDPYPSSENPNLEDIYFSPVIHDYPSLIINNRKIIIEFFKEYHQEIIQRNYDSIFRLGRVHACQQNRARQNKESQVAIKNLILAQKKQKDKVNEQLNKSSKVTKDFEGLFDSIVSYLLGDEISPQQFNDFRELALELENYVHQNQRQIKSLQYRIEYLATSLNEKMLFLKRHEKEPSNITSIVKTASHRVFSILSHPTDDRTFPYLPNIV